MREENVLEITHLRYSFHSSEAFTIIPVSYIRVNCTFRSKVTDPHTESFHRMLVSQSEEYTRELTIDDPENYTQWLMERGWDNLEETYEGYGNSWVPQEPLWKYLDKFDTFQFRDAVSDNPSTRFILDELTAYNRTGELICNYRHPVHSLIIRHLKALSLYYD